MGFVLIIVFSNIIKPHPNLCLIPQAMLFHFKLVMFFLEINLTFCTVRMFYMLRAKLKLFSKNFDTKFPKIFQRSIVIILYCTKLEGRKIVDISFPWLNRNFKCQTSLADFKI